MKGLEISPYLKRIKESLAVYRWVFKNTVPERSKKHLKRMIPFMFLYEAFGMAIPLCFGFIVNAVIKGENHAIFFVLIVVLMILRLILHRKYMIEREYVKGYNESALNNFITNNLLSKSIGQHIRFKEELSQSSMNRARSSIQYLTALMLFEGIASMYSLFLSFCFLWFLAPFAGFILTITLTLYVFGSLLMNKEVIEKFGPIDKDFKRHNDKLEESWNKSIRILSLGKGKDIADILDRRYESINDSSRNFWIGFIDKITLKDLINVFSLAVVYGAYMFGGLEKDAMSVGFLLPLFSWSWNVVNNIWRIGHIEQEFNWHLPAIKKLKHSLEITPDIVDHNPKVSFFTKTPIITFENLSFSHVKDGFVKETLRDLSFSINPGEKVALIAASGVGKTTIAKLLQRAYDPHSGCIRVDGHDLRDVSIKAWNEIIGEIPQQVDIFDGTLRDNLLIAVQTEDHHEYNDEVLQRTMDHFAIDFCREKGLETKVGPNGVWLSGGQGQRVAIAQIALKKKASVLIIDEATSNLDATTEKQVQNGFLKLLKEDKSALVVAHNLSTVRNICDKFIVLRSLEDTPEGESQIERQGNSFEEIYPHSPILRRLMEDQGLSLENREKAFV